MKGYETAVRKHIIGPIGQMYMDEVTTDDLRLLLVLIPKKSASLYNLYNTVNMLIKRIFYSAEESHVIEHNPSATLSAKGGIGKRSPYR